MRAQRRQEDSDVLFEKDKLTDIAAVQFLLASGEDMRRLSHIEICEQDMYSIPSKRPVLHGVNDERLGVSSKRELCTTCGLRLQECVGHFGYFKLELPVFHIGFFTETRRVLQKICKNCSKVLLPPEMKLKYMARFNKSNEHYARKLINTEIMVQCKKRAICPYCGDYNGAIKKVGSMKIVHEKYKGKTGEARVFMGEFHDTFEEAKTENKDVAKYLSKAQEDLNPMKVLRLFRNIPQSDVFLLDMNPRLSRPERMIWTHMLVPPCCIRPSVPQHEATTEDDLTTTLTRIISVNKRIKDYTGQGNKIETLIDLHDELHFQCAQFINSDLPGFSSHQKTGRKQRSLVQRIKGKHGRFRGNLSGKRVDFSARSVISPDPNLDIDQVAIPMLMAKRMTFPERVFQANIRHLQKLIINGPQKHPGAVYVTFLDGSKTSLTNLSVPVRIKIARKLKFGMIVERHMLDDDIILFNRQPSLHRISIMAHRVKVMPYRTLRLNLCVCTPYNADFDGDEMNVHFPQTYDARAEATELMSVLHNLQTPRSGEPIIAAIQDFITCAYLLTQKDTFYTRDQFCQNVSYMGIKDEKIDIPAPAIMYPVEMWTGKQLVGVLIKPNDESRVLVNLECEGRNYTDESHMCVNDSYICIVNSELLSGTLDKSVLGSGRKTSLFYIIEKNYGAKYAAVCMSRLAKFSSNWLTNRGFSIGIDDVTPSQSLCDYKLELIEIENEKYEDLMTQFNNNELKPAPGCTVEQTLESLLNNNYSEIRTNVGKMAVQELHFTNSLAIMSRCGSKGSSTNISQMMGLVGQQSVEGKRIQNGFEYRTLPHYDFHDRSAAGKGFIPNSFYDGITATEFFFHTMGGREGLVDTAVKTSTTGYMQRRLMKALEDLSVQYDGTLRNSEDRIIQFHYGDDMQDPLLMEQRNGRPINLRFELTNAINWNDGDSSVVLNGDEIYERCEIFVNNFTSPPKIIDVYGQNVQVPGPISLDKPFSMKFREEFLEFITNYVIQIRKSEVFGANIQHSKTSRIRANQLDIFFKIIKKKIIRSMAEPGEAMGAIAGQSIGEPGTQMTLKTFHFAGVASMDVTLGVPRILEIINATRAKSIKTPIITSLLLIKEESAANVVKGRIERTTLEQIAVVIEEVEEPSDCYIRIKLDRKLLQTLFLKIPFEKIVDCIVNTKGCKEYVKGEHLELDEEDDHMFYIKIPDDSKVEEDLKLNDRTYYVLQELKDNLKKVIVSGIPTITRAVVKRKKNSDRIELLAEGLGLLQVMGTAGVDALDCSSNNILEVEQVLGIEAARSLILYEINFTMKQYGMSVDMRHLKLVSDLMTFQGQVLGINRHGIPKMKSSVLLNASFERTTDHLFNAAIHTTYDEVVGVSDSIIFGKPITLGTGKIKVLQNVDYKNVRSPRLTLFDEI